MRIIAFISLILSLTTSAQPPMLHDSIGGFRFKGQELVIAHGLQACATKRPASQSKFDEPKHRIHKSRW